MRRVLSKISFVEFSYKNLLEKRKRFHDTGDLFRFQLVFAQTEITCLIHKLMRIRCKKIRVCLKRGSFHRLFTEK
ncbi:hypothetical protein DQM68_09790 [Leptospira mayottensis]|uniref:Uncharacterized protein n=1 Tax=Leptospira mayottensis TaxID=1137606 RepID=A0ABM6Y9U0_9LEPT|nr:hypothetical protein DQM68_09790 [Leptospira mayottensis]AXR64803.1 hypothetical protein DQM28_11840 [Leptospira mayottensis]AZQ02636.1 hypothetical protein LEP1GSC190_11895 [Leptospira mayottensis 200901116]